MKELMIEKTVEQKIYLIRGFKVMFDDDLARLYGVQTKRLLEAVRRNRKRFPIDFMFQISWEEATGSRSQFASLKRGQNLKYRPYVFTEQGVAMLSSVLRSDRAIEVNIAIMRAFVKLREIITQNKELAGKLNELERKVGEHDEEIAAIFDAIKKLMRVDQKPKRKKEIGFHVQY